MFEKGARYSRKEISAKLGGQVQAYLPTVKGEVVAICVNPAMNPDAPEIVLFGSGEQVESSAKSITEAQNSLPTFVKRGNKEWEYVGLYRVTRQSFDPTEIREHERRAGRIGEVRSILYLEGG